MKLGFLARLSYGIFVSGFLLFASGCSNSPNPVTVKPKRPVSRVTKLLPNATYDRAFSLASSSRERDIVKSCQRLEGKRKKANVDSDTLQTMQEVLFESETPEVRAAAAAGLGNAGDVDATPNLLDALEDESLLTREAAAKALGKLLGWTQGFRPDDPPDKRAEAVERFRERWLLFKGSDLYQVATDPEAQKRTRAIVKKRAKFEQRRERLPTSQKEVFAEANDFSKPKTQLSPQSPPTNEELRLQLERYKEN